ncbi:hypothetical protein ACFLU5_16095 [Bacteroidota bacterium]
MEKSGTILIIVYVLSCCSIQTDAVAAKDEIHDRNRIRPYSENPMYWQYKGKPILLLGGSKDDNLFQIPDLKEHLDLLASVGGNYIRNTMSSRNDKGFEVQPFKKLSNGKYDLDQWNDEYWNRFENLLKWTNESNIIVQIEIWDRFDYSGEHWEYCTWNPKNNVNYPYKDSGFLEHYLQHPGKNEQPFFKTVPGLDNNNILLEHQKAFVDKLLSYSLKYNNLLYCIDNEFGGDWKWSDYWAGYIKSKAMHANKTIEITEMFDNKIEDLFYVIEQRDRYSFVEGNKIFAPQIWAPKGEKQWYKILELFKAMENYPRPLTMVKLRGTSYYMPGDEIEESEKKYIRALLGGYSALRFHRPPSLGLSDPAKAIISAVRKLENQMKMWEIEPIIGLLKNREVDEAYLSAKPGEKYALYFTDGGSVDLDLNGYKQSFKLKWLDLKTGDWGEEMIIKGGEAVQISAPNKGGWLAAIVRI